MARRTVRLGVRDVLFSSGGGEGGGPTLSQIEDSSPLLSDPAALRARFARDGFVFLRGALGAATVLAARARVLAHLEDGGVLSPGSGGVLAPAGSLSNLEGRTALTHSAELLDVLEGAPLRAAVAALLDTRTDALATFDYKWLRAVPPRIFTGAHCDSVYMSRGTRDLLTAWVPLEPSATLELGSLAMLRGSHAAPGLEKVRGTYGAFDTESEPGFEGSGWLTDDPAELAALDANVQWVGGDFSAGDVIIFGLRTFHMSTANTTKDTVRISADVRWQRAEEPIDGRYVGTADEMATKSAARKKGGAWADVSSAAVTMADLRAKWGI